MMDSLSMDMANFIKDKLGPNILESYRNVNLADESRRTLNALQALGKFVRDEPATEDE